VSISSTFYVRLFLYKNAFHSSSLITVWLCSFSIKNNGAKAARKMLMKLTTGKRLLRGRRREIKERGSEWGEREGKLERDRGRE